MQVRFILIVLIVEKRLDKLEKIEVLLVVNSKDDCVYPMIVFTRVTECSVPN